MRKIYSFLFMLLLAVMSVNSAHAAYEPIATGDGWKVGLVDGTWTLTISNAKHCKDYASSSDVPWSAYSNDIVDIYFDSNVPMPHNIGKNMFANMPKLRFITASNYSGSSKIGDNAFRNCPKLQTVTFADEFSSVGERAFENCSNLSSLRHITGSIGNYAFQGCILMKTAPTDYCTSVGDYAFKNCEIWYVELTACQKIGKYAFQNCPLETITFGNSLGTIDDYAFYNGIEDNAHIYVTGTPPATMGTGVFNDVNCSTVTLHVPEELGNAYNVAPWNQFNRTAVGTKIYGVYNGTTLTLYYDGSMVSRGGIEEWWTWHYADQRDATTKVVLDASMNAVRPESTAAWFFNFESLTQIDHFDRLHTEKVEDMHEMFSGCKKLASIDLSRFSGASATNMSGLFANCESLTELNVNYLNLANVTLTNSMFYKCKKLERIYCENDWSKYSSQITASNDMFYGCVKLKGGKGTVYNADNVDITFARPDDATDAPGYFWRADDDGINHEGIEDVRSTDVQSTKIIRDGMLLIERNGKSYNMQGVEVK